MNSAFATSKYHTACHKRTR